AITAVAAQTMLTPGIHSAYQQGVKALSENAGVRSLGNGVESEAPNQCQAALFTTSAEAFINDHNLQDEVFGSSSVVIECDDMAQLKRVTEKLEGQLTATIQMEEADTEQARSLLPTLEEKAGRILVNGWPTGVEVCHAMVHGGPFPATSDSRSTSVGSSAIHRFLRPVCYQNLPQALLPEALRDGNPLKVSQLVDGKRIV
ncbi:MAG: aldehyde dehydrogenase (NADP(+)), partial [Marinobacter sp.]